MPAFRPNGEMGVSFSNDEKKLFYLNTQGGVANIWCITIADKYGRIIAGPTNAPVQVTKFTDRSVVRFIHLLGAGEVLFRRLADNGKDYHIYRMKDDGSGSPQDLTPGADGVTSEIIGASYNGRYVYYTENKVNRDKLDTYRYDCNQFITDLVFPNDKDWQVLAWTRDQKKLLIVNPNPGGYLVSYDIESTERTPLVSPKGDAGFTAALLDPSGQQLTMFEGTEQYQMTIGTNVVTHVATGVSWLDYSPNGKYLVTEQTKKWSVKEIASGASLDLPDGAQPMPIAQRESMLVYSLPAADGKDLYLYDISKKASTKLVTIASK